MHSLDPITVLQGKGRSAHLFVDFVEASGMAWDGTRDELDYIL